MLRELMVLAALGCIAYCRERHNLDELMNVCLDGVYHKQRAGPEPQLHGNCSQWSNMSCCTANISREMHQLERWHDFGYDHCDGHVMSDSCRQHFTKDLCFYECSPNTGPWAQPVQMKIRNEKVIDAPLCQSDCDAWWNDCKADFTCVENWGKDFNWTGGQNRCPAQSTCRPFTEIFQNATRFCQIVWDHSWLVQPNDKPCMKLTFAPGSNPNREVAKQKAREILDTNHATAIRSVPLVVTMTVLLQITRYKNHH